MKKFLLIFLFAQLIGASAAMAKEEFLCKRFRLYNDKCQCEKFRGGETRTWEDAFPQEGCQAVAASGAGMFRLDKGRCSRVSKEIRDENEKIEVPGNQNYDHDSLYIRSLCSATQAPPAPPASKPTGSVGREKIGDGGAGSIAP